VLADKPFRQLEKGATDERRRCGDPIQLLAVPECEYAADETRDPWIEGRLNDEGVADIRDRDDLVHVCAVKVNGVLRIQDLNAGVYVGLKRLDRKCDEQVASLAFA